MKNNKTSLKKRSIIWLVFWTLVFSIFATLPGVMAEDGEEKGGLPPVADAGGPYTTTECKEIIFDASGSYDPEGNELLYRWSFDGTWTTWSSSPYEAHVWYDDFNGEVTLEVTDGIYSVTDTAEVIVENVAPTIFVSFGYYIIGDLDTELDVNVEFWDPDDRSMSDDTHTVTFDWGDGMNDTYDIAVGENFVVGYHTYIEPGEYTLTITVTDDDGGSSSVTIYILIEGVYIGEDVTIYEGETFSRTGMFFFVESEADSGKVNYGDSIFDEELNITEENFVDGVFVFDLNHMYPENGDFLVNVELYDPMGNVIGSNSITVHVLNVAPNITSIENLPSDPIPVGTTVDLSATFTDPGLLDTHIAAVNWGDGTEEAANVNERTITSSHTYSEAGVYTLTITVEDDDGGIDEEIYQYVVVYDPDNGFVTGGGWINSPEGAYKPDPTLTGKSTFGFVSKYKKGQSTPSGNTEFQFHAAKLNFHSKDYDWLVIAGSKAMYKGTGTINNEGNYGFMLSAIDGDLQGNSEDKFRIKIWNKNTDEIIYDNNLSGDDNDDPATILGGGQIKIHKK